MPESGKLANGRSLASRLKAVWEKTDENMRCDSCARCICVSETEFTCVLEYLLKNCPKGKILDIIRKSKEQLAELEREKPDIAAKIKGTVLLRDLMRLDREALPFSCVFFEDGQCAIAGARPLKCRGAEAEFYGFMLLRRGNTVIIRRPAPMFYYFSLIFKDENELDSVSAADFFRGVTELDEAEYIDKLFEKNSRDSRSRP